MGTILLGEKDFEPWLSGSAAGIAQSQRKRDRVESSSAALELFTRFEGC
jgi:hypothetical protein